MREARLWALHLFSGAALIVLLGVHMAVQHFEKVLRALGWVGENVRGFASVAGRGASPAWSVLYVLLLAFALYHGLYGTRRVLREIWHSPRAGRLIDVVAVLFGLIVFVYGLQAVLLAGRLRGAF